MRFVDYTAIPSDLERAVRGALRGLPGSGKSPLAHALAIESAVEAREFSQVPYDRLVDALELRYVVYRHFIDTGTAPTRQTLSEVTGDLETTDQLLSELHERHMLVLDDRPTRRGEIRMALPFAAEPTHFRVTTDEGSWWANCAWDSLAVLAALHGDGLIRSSWSDTGEPFELGVVGGELERTDGFISFPLPASRWWDDIVFT